MTLPLDPRPPLRRFVAPRVDVLVRRRYRTLSRRRAPDPALDASVADARRKLADADISGRRRAPELRRALVDQFHRLYYHSSKQTWQNTRFLGVPVWKSPLDLWLYQEMIHELRPDVLVEAGTKYGGSAYYFARLFDLLGHGQVITIDVKAQPDRPEHPRITYLSGSSADAALADRVMGMVGGGKPLIVLDSDHHRDHVLAELRLWSPRVPLGSYIVVEDTHADGHPVTTRFGPGPWDAVERFLAESDAFEIDESMHTFFMTFNPRGYLRRVR